MDTAFNTGIAETIGFGGGSRQSDNQGRMPDHLENVVRLQECSSRTVRDRSLPAR